MIGKNAKDQIGQSSKPSGKQPMQSIGKLPKNEKSICEEFSEEIPDVPLGFIFLLIFPRHLSSFSL